MPKNKPLRSQAIGSPSPCCAPIGGVFTADPHSDCFFCSKCNRLYTLDEVLDDVLDIAAKPKARPAAPGAAGSVTMPRPKMVPLSRTLQTFPVKDELKAIGARWDHINKQWMVPEDKFAEAHQIVSRGTRAAPPPTSAPFTASKFAGLDTTDLDADAFMDMSWDRWSKQQKKSPVEAKPVVQVNKRLCWECGKSFDENAFGSKGVWEDFWCGCEGR